VVHPAAEQGAANARINLGNMYREGRGVEQDYEAAVRWYVLAAKHGHVAAQNNLGLMYRSRHCIPQDFVAAVKWYTLAAEQGTLMPRVIWARCIPDDISAETMFIPMFG
jgi:uncharacterized protein